MLLRTLTCSRTGASESRIKESLSSLSPGGVQRVSSHPIGMNTNPRRRTGLAGVLAHAVAAGIIASNNGRDSVAPMMPRRNVRRGKALFVINIDPPKCVSLPAIDFPKILLTALNFRFELLGHFQFVFEHVFQPIPQRFLLGSAQLLYLLFNLFKRRHAQK